MAEEGEFDFAILDVSLNGEMSHPIAVVLDARGLPYAFATGYGASGVKGARRQATTQTKPFSIEESSSRSTAGLAEWKATGVRISETGNRSRRAVGSTAWRPLAAAVELRA